LIKCRAAEDCPAATAEKREVIMVDNHVGLPHSSLRLDSLEFPAKQQGPSGQRTANLAAQEMLARVMGAFSAGGEICAATIREEVPVSWGKEEQDTKRRRAGFQRKARTEEQAEAEPNRKPPDSKDFHLDYIRDRRKGPVADSSGGPAGPDGAAAAPGAQPGRPEKGGQKNGAQRPPAGFNQRRGAHKYGDPEALSYSIAAKQELPLGSDYQVSA